MSAGVASVGKIQWRLSGQISKVRDFFVYPFPEIHMLLKCITLPPLCLLRCMTYNELELL